MAQKKQTVKEATLPPMLVESREEARGKLEDRLEKGKKLRDQPFNSQQALEQAINDENKWSEYNSELLKRLFDNFTIANEYVSSSFAYAYLGSYTFHGEVNNFRQEIGRKITKLESILERLDLIPELNSPSTKPLVSANQTIPITNDVFIVHGQDEGTKETVARFLSKFDLNPIILHEQANAGKTIIEKFESHASSVGCAVVLMTPDDIGYIKDKVDQAKPRARQNVIFELGYFIGKLSRKNVFALYSEGVELPSDYQGVLFIPLDKGGVWKLQLAKELKNAGLYIDMNKL